MTGPEHYREAQEAMQASTWQRQQWGEGMGQSFLDGAFWEMRRAQVHAVLALTAATALPFPEWTELLDPKKDQ